MLAALTGAILPVVTLAAGAVILSTARKNVRQTTLVSPWAWTIAALVAWSLVELAAALLRESGATWLAPIRLAAIALTFCPAVSLIGAKRPQHAAWNFVVLSLWAIVALPAAENYFLHPGQKLTLGDARGWFLWVLLLLGPINFVPTRFWAASLLVAAGQFLALAPYLALIQRSLLSQGELLGLALCGCGLINAALAARRPTTAASPYDRLWLDFRDSFGLFWSLRVQERVNAAAQQYGWNLELTWSGFQPRGRESLSPMNSDPVHPLPTKTPDPLAPQHLAIDAAIEPALRTTFKGLLRRFVSHEWIAARKGESLD